MFDTLPSRPATLPGHQAPELAGGGVRRDQERPSGFWLRVSGLAVLAFIGYGASYVQLVSDALAGSRAALLVVGPLLVALAATGYRNPTHGVADNESDWVAAAILGTVGSAVSALIAHRYPTLSGFWRLDLIGAVLWVMAAAMILFGLRHVVRMWQVWVLALACATPVPSFLASAALGGSNRAVALVGVAVGTIATYVAGARAPFAYRCAATLVALVVGLGVAMFLAPVAGILTTVLAAGVAAPLLATAALQIRTRATRRHRLSNTTAKFPRRSVRSLIALVVIAVALLLIHSPKPRQSLPKLVQDNWMELAGLHTATNFEFIRGFLGPGSSLTRYTVRSSAGLPATAIDVIATTNLAALRDYAEAVWYPSRRPVNYRPAELDNRRLPAGARAIYTNADSAKTNDDHDWYAVTWTWRTSALYEQVIVIVDQGMTPSSAPPPPQPLSFTNTMVKPILWILGQQPEWDGNVPTPVIKRANDIIDTLLAAGDSAARH